MPNTPRNAARAAYPGYPGTHPRTTPTSPTSSAPIGVLIIVFIVLLPPDQILWSSEHKFGVLHTLFTNRVSKSCLFYHKVWKLIWTKSPEMNKDPRGVFEFHWEKSEQPCIRSTESESERLPLLELFSTKGGDLNTFNQQKPTEGVRIIWEDLLLSNYHLQGIKWLYKVLDWLQNISSSPGGNKVDWSWDNYFFSSFRQGSL